MEPRWHEAVRIRAYHIWEAEGRPEGRASEHWAHAMREMGVQTHQISRIASADSVLDLLGRVDIEKFPPDERMAVSTVQVEVLDQWLTARLSDPESAARSTDG